MMRFFSAAVFAALFLLSSGVASAQDVTLTSRDGTVVLDGTFLGFDGDFYRIDTVYGPLTVDASGVLCEGPACPDLTSYVADIAISTAPELRGVLWPALIEAFARETGYQVEEPGPGQFALSGADGVLEGRIRIRATTADEAFADLLAGEADLIATLRELRPLELALGRDAGLGDLSLAGQQRVLALDGLVPAVAPGNPIDAIDLPTLATVLSGQVSNWALLGGPDAPVHVHLRNARSGAAQTAEDKVLAPFGLAAAADARRHDSNADLTAAILQDPFGIGLVSQARQGNTAALPIRGDCGFVLRSGRHAIKAEDYPLTAPVFLIRPVRRLPKMGRDLLVYLQSGAAQRVIRRAGYIDQGAETISISAQGDRLRNAIVKAGDEVPLAELQRMMARLGGMDRLTTSFRFTAGSSRLDAQSRFNVRLLAAALEGGEYDGRKLLFAGFSDGEGAADTNRQISLKRAQAVMDAVRAEAEAADLAQVTLEVDGFGEALPMACDDQDWGRQVNRRVEVWVQ